MNTLENIFVIPLKFILGYLINLMIETCDWRIWFKILYM